MAKISSLKTNNQLRAPRRSGGVSPNLEPSRAFGAAAEALTGLGMQIARKKEAAEATDFISSSMAELNVKHNEKRIEAKLKFPESGKGYSAFLKSSMDKEILRISKNSPNSKASAAFTARANTFIGSVEIEADTFEAKRANTFFRANAKKTSDVTAASYVLGPDTDGALVSMASEGAKYDSLSGNTLTIEEARKMKEESLKNIWTSNISGYANNKEFNLSRRLLNVNPGGMFDAAEIVRIKKSLDAQEQRELGIDIRNENQKIKKMKREVEVKQEATLRNAFIEGADSETVLKKGLVDGSVTPSQYVKFRKQATSLQQFDSDEFMANIRNLQAGGFDDKKILGILRADVNSATGSLTGKDAAQAFSEIARRQGIADSSLRSRRLKDAEITIKSAIINPLFPTKSQKMSSAQAITTLHKRLDGNKDLDPDIVGRAILKDTLGSFKSMKLVSGVSPQFQMGTSNQESTLKNFGRAFKQLKSLRDRGLIETKTYMNRLLQLERREEAYKRDFFEKGSFDEKAN